MKKLKFTIKKFSLLVLGIVSCCTTKPDNVTAENEYAAARTETKVKEIALVNAGNIDRCGMGDLIHKISRCNPKAVGINVLFVGDKDESCDSTLYASILTSDKVILIEGFENGTTVESNQRFSEAAFLTGLSGLIHDENDAAIEYLRLIGHRGKWELSFPFLLALQFDKTRAAELSSKITRRTYPIIIYHPIDEFNLLDYNTDFSNDCSIIEGKIVVIGYLGPAQEDIVRIKTTKHLSGHSYGTVVLANIILDILNDLN